VLAGYAGFLNSLNFPIQVLVRLVPVDLGRYPSVIEERASLAVFAMAGAARRRRFGAAGA
jgi:hypothetical protein